MKRILFLFVTLSLSCFVFVGCAVDDNDMGDRAAKKWNEFVQKNLIGDWEPTKIELAPLVGKPLVSMPYPHNANCTKDNLKLKTDYTGDFTRSIENCVVAKKELTWKHQVGVVSFYTKDGLLLTTVPIEKNSKNLELLIPAIELESLVDKIDPKGELIDRKLLKLFAFRITFVKK